MYDIWYDKKRKAAFYNEDTYFEIALEHWWIAHTSYKEEAKYLVKLFTSLYRAYNGNQELEGFIYAHTLRRFNYTPKLGYRSLHL